MMIGFEVAPVAPSARLVRTKSGSIESSQSFVPLATNDSKGVEMLATRRVIARIFRESRHYPLYIVSLHASRAMSDGLIEGA